MIVYLDMPRLAYNRPTDIVSSLDVIVNFYKGKHLDRELTVEVNAETLNEAFDKHAEVFIYSREFDMNSRDSVSIEVYATVKKYDL